MIYCNLYNTKCHVEETNADEYPTPCHWCNSGKGKSYKEHFVESEKLLKEKADLENECLLLGKYIGFLKSVIKSGEYFDEHKHHFEWFCRKYQESTSAGNDVLVNNKNYIL
ncbi:hypothetical protein [Bacillus gaemokensis]|uniref:Uncharacterized protein n=1 Tax=Bacillus gaemokensis TaxID=574375 RepID=A0A073KNE7_9BACI|nr:hypothetical protein [Bacillus gaemokensis]KEK23898.1 hypothetical protein BAGA_05510 [Bacillus gaemokensis]KYG38139.1 hypothetical protein AZF08_20540 [Bacillus gaemokensis]